MNGKIKWYGHHRTVQMSEFNMNVWFECRMYRDTYLCNISMLSNCECISWLIISSQLWVYIKDIWLLLSSQLWMYIKGIWLILSSLSCECISVIYDWFSPLSCECISKVYDSLLTVSCECIPMVLVCLIPFSCLLLLYLVLNIANSLLNLTSIR